LSSQHAWHGASHRSPWYFPELAPAVLSNHEAADAVIAAVKDYGLQVAVCLVTFFAAPQSASAIVGLEGAAL
jgi:hypothetical protein